MFADEIERKYDALVR